MKTEPQFNSIEVSISLLLKYKLCWMNNKTILLLNSVFEWSERGG